ncbi:uncharacterized protein BDZ99DRAFT_492786 [Mytilinidion resinicola]|uniref:Transcription factor domain-containing protein n=1 Tax=Mytilinidion resinicola TaxID=574789 RepID=A0A6A6Z7R5_9PEZI|nr:uncharacterized protein BDZ99DRAFT_492786 [Mytilinidion resinicola]KAF2816838.1 hypothetical protein BDZ99DRAFT_492786 [Mytilinidion resinicola]
MSATEGSSLAGDNAPQKPSDQQLNRACEPYSGSSTCQRCAKAKRTCVFVAPQKRRQRKRTDVRVAELEREVRQMRALLKASKISHGIQETEELDDSNSDDQESTPDQTPDPASVKLPSLTHLPWGNESPIQPPVESPGASESEIASDIVSRGLITMDMANEFLNLYREELCDYYPGTLIPDNCTASELRQSKPVLFLSIMAATSQSKGFELSERLFAEVLKVYADRIFIKGEKRLEYVQALVNTICYYTAPGTQAQLQFYQYSNMAATMAIEIGIASKPRTHKQLPQRHGEDLVPVSSPDGLLENCRTILLCYLLTAGLSMRLRRPNILVFNSWMAECMSLLETSPILADKQICAWVRLQRIADEATTAFGFDDASTSFGLTELRMQVVLREFERKMDAWMRTTPPDVMNLSMRISYQQDIIMMWDFAIDEGKHDAPNFRHKYFTLPALDQPLGQGEKTMPLKSLQITATLKCMDASQSLLDEFLSLSAKQLQKVPNVFFVRAAFSLVVLMKADYALWTNQEGLSELMDAQSLKLDYYLNTVVSRIAESIGPQICRVPSHWLNVIKTRILPWYEQYQQVRLSRNASPQQAVAVESHGPTSNSNQPSAHIASPTGAFVAFPGGSVSLSITGSDLTPLPAATGNPGHMTFSKSPANIDQVANNDSQWNFLADDSTYMADKAAFPADMNTLFDQGDLYFWNDEMDLSGPWMPPSSDFDVQSQYPPQGS